MRIPVIKLEKAVRELAAEHPRAKYKSANEDEGCKYSSGKAAGQPGCIVGQALRGLGFSETKLKDMDEKGSYILHFLKNPGSRAAQFLTVVQQCQDNGIAWGEAVKKADQECAS